MANFPIFSMEQSNPVLSGYSAVQKILQDNLLSQYQSLLNKQRQIQNKYQPEELEQTLLGMRNKNELAPLLNEHQRIVNQYLPERNEAELNALKEKVGNPLLNTTGTAGQIGAALYLKQHPELISLLSGTRTLPQNTGTGTTNSEQLPLSQEDIQRLSSSQKSSGFDPIEAIQNSISLEEKRKNSVSDFVTKKANSIAYNSLPKEDKAQALAQLRGMGIDATEASRRLSSGETVDEIAESAGYGKENRPESVFSPTLSDRNRANNRAASVIELNYLSDKVSNALAPYSQKIGSQSPLLINDLLSGKNVDKVSSALAARGLSSEVVASRLRTANSPSGIQALREVAHNSLYNLDVPSFLISPKYFKEAQKKMDDWLTEAVNLANKQQLNPGKKEYNNDNDPLGIR